MVPCFCDDLECFAVFLHLAVCCGSVVDLIFWVLCVRVFCVKGLGCVYCDASI